MGNFKIQSRKHNAKANGREGKNIMNIKIKQKNSNLIT